VLIYLTIEKTDCSMYKDITVINYIQNFIKHSNVRMKFHMYKELLEL